MIAFATTVYLLCFLTSTCCLVLLLRGYLRTKVKLLFWCSMAFVGFALNNLLLFLDLVILPDTDLRPLRTITMIGALAVLIYGFIWRME